MVGSYDDVVRRMMSWQPVAGAGQDVTTEGELKVCTCVLHARQSEYHVMALINWLLLCSIT